MGQVIQEWSKLKFVKDNLLIKILKLYSLLKRTLSLQTFSKLSPTNETLCAIWYHVYNFKNLKNNEEEC